jgi:hypothetical protein
MVLPDPTTEPTMSVDRASEILGIGRRCAYVECHKWLDSGGVVGVPALQFGRAIRVPTAALLTMIGADVQPPPNINGCEVTEKRGDSGAGADLIKRVTLRLEVVGAETEQRREDE